MTRLTILWAHWSGYMDACARALVEEQGCELTIGFIAPEGNAPFEQSGFFQYPCNKVAVDPMQAPLPDAIVNANEDILLVCSWHQKAYRQFALSRTGRSVRILAMDNQWLGTLRQWLGVIAAPFYVRPVFDRALVPGRRQRDFARRLGFKQKEISEGHYACDFAEFGARYRTRQQQPLTRNFLFAGRLVPQKGIDVLFEAWKRFLAKGKSDWNLVLVGGGKLPPSMTLPPRVTQTGFVQPSALPDTFLKGDVFVLPSNWEPWGLVVHEAASTGMPMICSSACGAADAYLEDGKNGCLIPPNDADALLAAFEKLSALDEGALRAMGTRSYELAAARTPSTWAATVIALSQPIQ